MLEIICRSRWRSKIQMVPERCCIGFSRKHFSAIDLFRIIRIIPSLIINIHCIGIFSVVIHQKHATRTRITKVAIRLTFDDINVDRIANRIISISQGREEINTIGPGIRDIRETCKRLASVHREDHVRDIAIKKLALRNERGRSVLGVPNRLVEGGEFKPDIDLVVAMINGRIRPGEILVIDDLVLGGNTFGRKNAARYADFIISAVERPFAALGALSAERKLLALKVLDFHAVITIVPLVHAVRIYRGRRVVVNKR